MEHPGKQPSQKKARSAQHEEDAEEDVETVVEGITFRASARPHNWRARGRPGGAGAGGARSKPKEKILPVKLRMTGVRRDPPITSIKKARNYPPWACTKCTYQHNQINGEASLRKCVMCGASRGFQGAEAEATISSAAAPRPPPPPRLSNAASTTKGHSFMCEGAAAVERACPECLTLSRMADLAGVRFVAARAKPCAEGSRGQEASQPLCREAIPSSKAQP